MLILPTCRSVVTPNRSSWTTASTFNKPSNEENGREEPGSPHQQSSQSFFERHRTSREVVLLPPPPAVVRDRPVSIENIPVHTEQLEKIPVVVPPVDLERSSSTFRFSRMDHPNWAPAGDVPPPIPVQVACEREMAARATYEADHPKLKRANTHGRCSVLGPLAKKMASRRERAMSIPGASSPKDA